MVLIDLYILLLPGNEIRLRWNDSVLKDVHQQLFVVLHPDFASHENVILSYFKFVYLPEFLSDLKGWGVKSKAVNKC